MRERLPLSGVNTVVAAIGTLAILVAIARGFWFAAAVLAIMVIPTSIGARYIRTHAGSDARRVNALEPGDERERAVLERGLAGVGVVAVVGSIGAFVAELLLTNSVTFTALPVRRLSSPVRHPSIRITEAAPPSPAG
jgi:acid phosphatase family membrane protein YuiD